jgi:hypothetical protein
MLGKQAVRSGRFSPLWLVCLCGLTIAGPCAAQLNQLLVSPGTLNYSAPLNSTAVLSQKLNVQSTHGPLTFNLSLQYERGTSGWLSFDTSSGTTPAAITVSVNPAGLAEGTYQALIGVQSGTQGVPVQVTLLVANNVAAGTTLVASPAAVLLSTQTSLVQTVQISEQSGAALPFSVFTATTNGGNWLVATPSTGTTPAFLTISGNTSSLIAGSYSGTVTVYPTAGGAPLPINVQLFVGGNGAGGLLVANPSLTFSSIANGTPAPQTDPITYSGGTVPYSASASASWIQLTSDTTSVPSQTVTGNTGTNLTVAVNTTGLSATAYQGTITVTAANLMQTINVTLTIGANGLLTVQPSSLFFNYLPGGSVPAGQTVVVSTSGVTLNYATSTNSAGWLQVSPPTGSTPGQITVSVNPAGWAKGTYNGSVTIAPVSGTPATIPVTMTVGEATSTSLTFSQSTLAFQTSAGVNPATQAVSVGTQNGSAVPISAVASSSGNWLSVTPTFSTSPISLLINANVAPLPNSGTYEGSITVSNLSDSTQAVIPVTLTITGGQVTAAPSSLSFIQAQGGAVPAAKTIQLTSAGPGQVAFSTGSNTTWLSVVPASGTTPSTLTVAVNAAGLTPGSYSGAVTITGGAGLITVAVALTVTNPATLTATPGALRFDYVLGASSAPGPQKVTAASSGGAIVFSVAAKADNGGKWLSVSANAGTTPATFNVLVDPTGLAAGSYSGSVTVTGSGASQTQTVRVTLAITAPVPSIATLLNAASLLPGAVAPGEIVTIKGSNLGPPTPGVAGTILTSGFYATSVAGTQVTFDGVAAPLLYVSAGQINAVVPYALNNKTTTNVQVSVNGIASSIRAFQVAPSAPGIFTVDASGSGQAAVINQDGTVNGPLNPAAPGSIIAIYATGEGQTTPSG